ncbi:MAG: hypothetical protein K2X73_01340 [Sphingomonas sp.]|uniref:hypothetical protein n=1 Tax=Sphingomonas sp. TaxID=28214 RepID=UPI0025D74CA8|nr:hypothetical protein [Sphingomonas sp.]MBX9880594.1 hypothetical protein [Sphingomonas sp.]
MILLIAALAANPTPPLVDKGKCAPARLERAGTPRPARPETLDRQPDAELYFTVWRSVDNCPKPVKVREARAR